LRGAIPYVAALLGSTAVEGTRSNQQASALDVLLRRHPVLRAWAGRPDELSALVDEPDLRPSIRAAVEAAPHSLVSTPATPPSAAELDAAVSVVGDLSVVEGDQRLRDRFVQELTAARDEARRAEQHQVRWLSERDREAGHATATGKPRGVQP